MMVLSGWCLSYIIMLALSSETIEVNRATILLRLLPDGVPLVRSYYLAVIS